MNWIASILCICLLVGGCSGEVSTEKTSLVGSASATEEVSSGTCPKDAKTVIWWNAMNFGYKKSDDTIKLMSDILLSRGLAYKDQKKKIKADIILLGEVNAGPRTGGIQAVARLQEALGQNWDSVTSDATSGDGTERYTILWKNGGLIINHREAKLIDDLADSVDREPYGTRLKINGKELWVYSFHAVPTAKNPIREAKLVASSGELASRETVILAGDFNLGRTTIESIFEGWDHHINEKTSLRSTIGKDGGYRSYQYDHILTKGAITVCEAGVIDFVSTHFSLVDFENLKRAREVSDHLPVYVRFTVQ